MKLDDPKSQDGTPAFESYFIQSADLSSQARKPMHLTWPIRILVAAICLFSLVEIPLELDPAGGATATLALVTANAIWLGLGAAALRGVRRAFGIFMILCGISLVAIVPGLPDEYRHSTLIFVLSCLECLLKASLLFAWAAFSGKP
ncbi:hypothetical protein [Paraburkholderia dipogonis]|jgi:hypothetical protein|uniref:hypothetical protein n=1 Tax=Paraburkholderia dipogonis TaxID=1211383 RepID=UPI0038BCE0BF